VLDRLLDDDTLAIDGVSGTSAGALNAAVLATGWAEGGRAGAQAALRAFWLDVGGQGGCFGNTGHRLAARLWQQPALPPVAAALPGFNLDQHPMYAWMQQFLRAFSPYQFNPFDINPLRDVVGAMCTQPALRSGPLSLFVTATAVRTGQPRVFTART
jgi:NTE family protein